MKISTQYSEI